MTGSILLTGATGFLGMEALAQLIDGGEETIVVLVRAEDIHRARARLAGVMAQLYEHPTRRDARVEVVCGDLLEPGLGISSDDRARLVGSVDRILHCAASISFDLPLEQARRINVGGVAEMISLAREIAGAGKLRRFVHVSTAYVSGLHEGEFTEQDLDVRQDFRNSYERSKHEAEHLLRGATDLPWVIARPSIVVGHQAGGWTPAFNVLYWPMRAVERGLLAEIPAPPDAIVDFVPVDYVIEVALRMLSEPETVGTYHLVAGESALSAAALVELHAALTGRTPAPFTDGADPLLGGGETLAPYFNVRCGFDDTRAHALARRAGIVKPHPRDYLSQLLFYAHHTSWGKRAITREAARRGCYEALPTR